MFHLFWTSYFLAFLLIPASATISLCGFAEQPVNDSKANSAEF
jgi:hypothetical protein